MEGGTGDGMETGPQKARLVHCGFFAVPRKLQKKRDKPVQGIVSRDVNINGCA